MLRNKEKLILKIKDLFKWKKKRRIYGHIDRLAIKTAFSSLKRMFGEHTYATKFQNMVKEMVKKGSV